MLDPATFYFFDRTDRLNVDQGYIFRGIQFLGVASATGIVVTPTCDLHNAEAKDLSVVVVLPVVPLWVFAWHLARRERGDPWLEIERKIDWAKLSNAGKDRICGHLHELIKGNQNGVHYLPPANGLGDSFVPFDNPIGVPITNFPALEFVAGLRAPYREYLSARFCSYYLRVGTADFSKEDRREIAGSCLGNTDR